MLDAFLEWLAALPTPATYAVLMVLAAVENVFPPVPADVAVALGAFLSQRGEVSAPWLGALCWVANTASSAGIFLFARRRGSAFLERPWVRRVVPPAALQAVRGAYEAHGVAGIFFSRFLPGVRAAVLPFAGVVGMPAARALVPAALASAAWYAMLVAAGALLGSNWQAVKTLVEDANRALAVVALAATACAAVWLWRRTRRAGG